MIYVPERIKVGYQNRKGTYTGRLAYVIYYDQTGKLRKEKSWQSWRHKDIEPDEFENVPMAGLVLNKKAGGGQSHWNTRQTYCRVHDPRGFEIEITVPNLLWILENTDCTRGKGLEGEFVYGWDGTELLLVPTTSPDYKEIKEASAILNTGTWLKGKDLTPGAVYLTNKNERLIYLGRFEFYPYSRWEMKSEGSKGKRHFFTREDEFRLVVLSSLTRKVLREVGDPVFNYAELMDRLECRPEYSPIVRCDYEPLVEFGDGNSHRVNIRRRSDGQIERFVWVGCHEVKVNFWFGSKRVVGTMDEILQEYELSVRVGYLENGNRLGG